jgi:electron transfer flavoprotein beta subunit
MHIVVCCKAVPFAPTKFSVSDDHTRIVYESSSLVLNESDEYALDASLLLKKKTAATVTVVTLGGLSSQEILYLSLAKGADHAVRIDSNASSPFEVAALLGALAAKKGADLVLVGVQSADQMASLVGGLLAASRGWPFVFAATAIEAAQAGTWVNVERELGEGRIQQLEVELPAVLGMQTGICPLTYAPPARRIKARQTRIEVVNATQLGFTAESLAACRRESIDEIMPPSTSRAARMLEGSADDMARFILDRIKETV